MSRQRTCRIVALLLQFASDSTALLTTQPFVEYARRIAQQLGHRLPDVFVELLAR